MLSNDGEGMHDRLPSPAASITIDLLLYLAHTPGSGSLRKLAKDLGVPRSTLHRILQTLEAKRAVTRTDDGDYTLGEAIAEIEARSGTADLPRLAHPFLLDLHGATGETVNLAVPDGQDMLIITTVQSDERLRWVSWEGMRDSLYTSALGKSYLAALPEGELNIILTTVPLVARTAKSMTNRETFLRHLRRIRSAGYAVDDGESTEGVRCVGAAIRADGRPIAAVSMSGPASRLPKKVLAEYGHVVAQAAAAIAATISGSLRKKPGATKGI